MEDDTQRSNNPASVVPGKAVFSGVKDRFLPKKDGKPVFEGVPNIYNGSEPQLDVRPHKMKEYSGKDSATYQRRRKGYMSVIAQVHGLCSSTNSTALVYLDHPERTNACFYHHAPIKIGKADVSDLYVEFLDMVSEFKNRNVPEEESLSVAAMRRRLGVAEAKQMVFMREKLERLDKENAANERNLKRKVTEEELEMELEAARKQRFRVAKDEDEDQEDAAEDEMNEDEEDVVENQMDEDDKDNEDE
ncbi:hypothetical protein HK101_002657 [Irineochytrium annulatum]|nr:hypothetical protein HK101_002657 [Irineochytrium annulatum]